MLRGALRFSALALFAAGALTAAIVWYFELHSLVELVNVTTLVALGLAFVAFPMIGPGRFARAHAIEADPRASEQGPDRLDNRTRGVLLLGVALLWLVLGIALHQLMGG